MYCGRKQTRNDISNIRAKKYTIGQTTSLSTKIPVDKANSTRNNDEICSELNVSLHGKIQIKTHLRDIKTNSIDELRNKIEEI